MELTSENVTAVFGDRLFVDGEDTSIHKVAEGIQCTVGFHPERLENHKDDVSAMLQGLPDEFHEGKGGGMSFLNACNNKAGHQWTGLHQVMGQLFMLGIALELAEYCMPRQMWSVLPGGMPYIVIFESEGSDKIKI